MAVRVRWIPRWGQHVVRISADGDQFLELPRETAWELVLELQRVLMTKPVAGNDHDGREH